MKTSNKWRAPLLTAVALYLVFSPIFAFPFYNTLVLHPFRCGAYDTSSINGVPVENVFFRTVRGNVLHAWYLKKPEASGVVLLSPGNAGNLTQRQQIIAELIRQNLSVFIYDYSGFGRSNGIAETSSLTDDARSAYMCLIRHFNVQPQNIILMGESLGTGITSKLASEKECAGVILVSAYTSLKQLALSKLSLFAVYPEFMYQRETLELNCVDSLRGTKKPVLLVHGAEDTLIPPSNSELIGKGIENSKVILLPEKDHFSVAFALRPVFEKELKLITQGQSKLALSRE